MENNFTAGARLHLWTAQTEAVLKSLRTDGFSQVKVAYIDKKYEESAWIFKEAYGFFKQKAGQLLKPPKGAESMIWLFFDPKWVYLSGDSYLFELSVPEEHVILFDREKWQRVLNLSYVGKDQADEIHFEQKMNQMGVSSGCEVFSSPFYPYLKSEIKKSWERIFEVDYEDHTRLMAAVWQLRQEDVAGVSNQMLSEKGDDYIGNRTCEKEIF